MKAKLSMAPTNTSFGSARRNAVDRLNNAAKVLHEIMDAPDQRIPDEINGACKVRSSHTPPDKRGIRIPARRPTRNSVLKDEKVAEEVEANHRGYLGRVIMEVDEQKVG